MITMITSKIKVYPDLQNMIGIIHLDRLCSEWSNNNKIPYMTKSYKKIKNIPYKNRNNIFGYHNNKMLLRTFSMPNNWLVDGELTAEENYLISRRKMCRKIRFNKDVRADIDSKIISIRYFNKLMFELSFKDNRQVFQRLSSNSIKGIKITLCDKHNVSIDRLNYLYENHRYDDLFRELCKRYEVYVSISHCIMDYSEKTRKDISDGNLRSVGIDLGEETFMSLSKPLLINGKMTDKIVLDNYLDEHARQIRNKHDDYYSNRMRMTRAVNVYKKRVFSIIKQIYKQVDVVFMEHNLNLSHQKFGTNSYFKSVLSCVDYAQYQLKQQAIYNRALCVQTPRNFSSSHTCSNCGSYNTFRGCSSNNLDVRSFVCTRCGAKHDRDINATINIEREGVKSLRFCIEFGRYPKRSEFATGSSNWRNMR